MSAEPFIIFFLLRSVRKIFRNTAIGEAWDQKILMVLYAVVVLFVLELVLHIGYITKWIWHALLIGIIILASIKKEFTTIRTLINAVLPFALISFFGDLFKLLTADIYKQIDSYLGVATVFSVVWMIAMFFVSRKQQKALRLEHEKTLQQEEQRKWVETKKEELEKIVAERTSELRHQKEQVENALAELKATQTQLIQSEKMASLGELTAGIAHEIQNPLNFVNNFAEVNKELLAEMTEHIEKGNFEEVKVIAKDIKANEDKINHHGKRADAIVKGMLQHSRQSTSGIKEPTDINALADEYLRLAYHGLRAKDKTFNATMKTDYDETIGKINIIPQDIGRAILNLITNAFYAVNEKAKNGSLTPEGGIGNSHKEYEPTVTLKTLKKPPSGGKGPAVLLTVKDNGNGIPQKVLDKIFQPFFTTKPTGQGTGLGLSLTYDIIKAHGGEIKVETSEGKGSTFIISLSLNGHS
jgi:two-component system, NtrC family, sensor kinase